MQSLSIIIPAYNEERTIVELLDAVRTVELVGGITKEIIVVDDASTDQTYALVQEYIGRWSDLKIQLYQHEKNAGICGYDTHRANPGCLILAPRSSPKNQDS